MKKVITKKSVSAILFITTISVIIIIFGAIYSNHSKTPITTEDFERVASEWNYIIEDAGEDFLFYDYIKEAKLAAPQNLSYQIEFYILSNEAYAKAFFNDNKEIFKDNQDNGKKEQSEIGKNYNRYVLTTNGKYIFIEQIENTVIYINTSIVNKNQAEAFLEKLDY